MWAAPRWDGVITPALTSPSCHRLRLGCSLSLARPRLLRGDLWQEGENRALVGGEGVLRRWKSIEEKGKRFQPATLEHGEALQRLSLRDWRGNGGVLPLPWCLPALVSLPTG